MLLRRWRCTCVARRRRPRLTCLDAQPKPLCASPATPPLPAGSTTYVIDPEFAYYGPMAFDVAKILANLLLAFFSVDGHASGAAGAAEGLGGRQ